MEKDVSSQSPSTILSLPSPPFYFSKSTSKHSIIPPPTTAPSTRTLHSDLWFNLRKTKSGTLTTLLAVQYHKHTYIQNLLSPIPLSFLQQSNVPHCNHQKEQDLLLQWFETVPSPSTIALVRSASIFVIILTHYLTSTCEFAVTIDVHFRFFAVFLPTESLFFVLVSWLWSESSYSRQWHTEMAALIGDLNQLAFTKPIFYHFEFRYNRYC